MSTVPKSIAEIEDEDPFRYGWRYVPRILPNGEEVTDTIPLTADDVLHPQEEDFIVTNTAHADDCNYIYEVVKDTVGVDPHTVVTLDCRIDWGHPVIRPLGPDIAAIFGVRKRRRVYHTFAAAVEGTSPSLIVEVTSENTRKNDLGIKVKYYDRLGVQYYAIVDRHPSDSETVRLIGYRRTETGAFERVYPDERGWLWLEPVKLWLGIDGGELAVFSADGKKLADYSTVRKARDAAEKKARAAEKKARAAEKKARAAEEKTGAAEEKARANSERVKELEAELARLRRGKQKKKGD